MPQHRDGLSWALRGFVGGLVVCWIVVSCLTGGNFRVDGLLWAAIGGVLTAFAALFLLVLIEPGETAVESESPPPPQSPEFN